MRDERSIASISFLFSLIFNNHVIRLKVVVEDAFLMKTFYRQGKLSDKPYLISQGVLIFYGPAETPHQELISRLGVNLFSNYIALIDPGEKEVALFHQGDGLDGFYIADI